MGIKLSNNQKWQLYEHDNSWETRYFSTNTFIFASLNSFWGIIIIDLVINKIVYISYLSSHYYIFVPDRYSQIVRLLLSFFLWLSHIIACQSVLGNMLRIEIIHYRMDYREELPVLSFFFPFLEKNFFILLGTRKKKAHNICSERNIGYNYTSHLHICNS